MARLSRPINDLDAVKNISILDVATRLGIVVRRTTSARCPFPNHADKNPSFSFYPKTNRCWCHGCGRGGDVISLVAITQGWTPGDAIRWLRKTYNLGSVSTSSRTVTPKVAPPILSRTPKTLELEANADIYEAFLADNPIGTGAESYLRERGFSKPTVAHFRLGYLANEHLAAERLIARFGRSAIYGAGLLTSGGPGARFTLPSPSVLFPFFERGRVVYVQSRLLPGASGQRWMGPRGIAKPVYNVDVIAQSRTIYICEGAPDVLAAYELKLAAIGLLGGTSHLPIGVLNALKERTVYLVPDTDEVGGQMEKNLASDLRGVGIQSVTKRLPCGKDVNEFLLLLRCRK